MLLKHKIYIFTPIVAILLVTVFFISFSKKLEIQSSLEEDLIGAPPMEFRLPNGKNATLKDFRGQALLLNFWATWCEPCLEEMPSLRALENHYKDRSLTILAINIQESPKEELQDKLSGIIAPQNLIFNVKRSQIATYRIEGIPYSILLDKNGIQKKVFEGPRVWNSTDIISQIDKVLSEK
jgi:thiol-disulfide isomerase/thioredoxin